MIINDILVQVFRSLVFKRALFKPNSKAALVFAFVLQLSFFSSCQVYKKQIPTGSAFRPKNVFSNLNYYHEKLSNVYLLEVDNKMQEPQIENHRAVFESVIVRNFARFHYFNLQQDQNSEHSKIVDIDSGRVDHFKIGLLGEEKAAQAVLKINVSQYRSYFPMRLHVKAVLIDCDTAERIWAFDEVFNTDEARIVNGMRYWWNTHMAGGYQDNRFSLNSLRPDFFLNYVFYTVAESYAKVRVQAIETIDREKKRLEREKEEMNKKANKVRLIDRIISIFN